MTVVLAAVRLCAAAMVLLGLGIVGIGAGLVPRRRDHLVTRALRMGCRLLLRSLGIHSVMQGPRPTSGSLIVANHLSWIDIPVALTLWRCTIVAKSEVRHWPVIGTLAARLGVIWIDRRRPRDLLRVLPQVEDALRRGQSVLLFPEGTTTSGREILPFRSGLFEAAVRTRASVCAASLSVSTAAGDHDALCWYGDETLLANIVRVAALRGARFSVHMTGPLQQTGVDRKMLARRARHEASRRLSSAQRREAVHGVSLRAKQNLRPIESSEREIFA